MRVTRVLVSPGKSYTSGQLPMNHFKHIRKAIQIILSGIVQPFIRHTCIYYSTNNSYDLSRLVSGLLFYIRFKVNIPRIYT